MIGQLRPPTVRHPDGDVAMTAPTTLAARARRGSDTEGRSTEELREIVSHVGAELELAPAEDIIEWAVATFGERFCVTSSMSDAVLSHLASKVAPGRRRASSSTPATTSPRPSAPATPSRRRCRST